MNLHRRYLLLWTGLLIILGILIALQRVQINRQMHHLPLPQEAWQEVHTLYRQQEIVFQQRGATWWMQRPYALPAAEHHLNFLKELLEKNCLAQYTYEEYPEHESLMTGAIPLRINTQKLRISLLDALNSNTYVDDGKSFYLCTLTLRRHLLRPPEQWLAYQLAPANVAIRLDDQWLSPDEARWIAEAFVQQILPLKKDAPLPKTLLRLEVEGDAPDFDLLALKENLLWFKPQGENLIFWVNTQNAPELHALMQRHLPAAQTHQP